MTATDRTAFWGSCEDCQAAIVVYPLPDREDDLPDTDEWIHGALGAECYICDGHVEWLGCDPVKDVIR